MAAEDNLDQMSKKEALRLAIRYLREYQDDEERRSARRCYGPRSPGSIADLLDDDSSKPEIEIPNKELRKVAGEKRFFMDQDNFCHWYIIPVDRSDDWDLWLGLLDSGPDPAACETPEFATILGTGPNSITFENPYNTVSRRKYV